ncbi:MAG: pyridoxal phosphate-dependent aminotransferase [Chloroflexota bacterium]
MNRPLSQRIQRIGNAGAFGVWEKAMALEAKGKKIIHLEIGEPDFDTPAHIIETAHQSMRNGRTHYGSPYGDMTLRETVADYVKKTRNTAVSPQNIVITPGVKGAIVMSLLTLVEHGDNVLVPAPYYPPYAEIIRYAGGNIIECPLTAADGFQINKSLLESYITKKTRVILINSPCNPTGVILNEASLTAVAELALEHDLWVISDEIYYQLNFTSSPPPSIFSNPALLDRTILLDGFSKPYAMTGWRLGFGVFPERVTKAIADLIVNYNSCVPLFIQDAGVAALTGPQQPAKVMLETYRKRRDAAIEIIDQIPNVSYAFPNGAFYIYLDISKTGRNAETFAYDCLEAGVALLPQGPNHIRVAFTQSESAIREGLSKMQQVLKTKIV